MSWSEEELRLFPMDYSEWEEAAGQMQTTKGMTVEEETFAGDGTIQVVVVTDCDIASQAFSRCENLILAILKDYRTEEDSFDPGLSYGSDEDDNGNAR